MQSYVCLSLDGGFLKLKDNVQQAARMQCSVEKRLMKDTAMMEAYNHEFQKFLDRGAISEISREEMDQY